MKKNSIYSFFLSLIFFVSCSTTTEVYFNYREIAEQKNYSCLEAVNAFVSKSEIKKVQGTLRFPKGFKNQTGFNIQYGFESEYIGPDALELLNHYAPTSDIYPEGATAWFALAHEKKLNFIKENAKQIFPYREKGKLQLATTDTDLKAILPEALVYDGGKFEIVLSPMETMEELFAKIEVINSKIGIGSMQAMVSTPFKTGDGIIIAGEQFYRETIGYYNFMNDLDTLAKMFSGSELYELDKGVAVLKNFNHPWLGPMTRVKHEKLKKYLAKIAAGEILQDYELKEISFLVISHKFVGGLSFRPDVAYRQGRIATEVRDCHQNLKCIKDKVLREVRFLEEGRTIFAQYSTLIPFDSIDAFDERLPKNLHEFMKRIFPKYDKKMSSVELDLFRNFSYPLRDWSKHIEAFGGEELRTSVKKAKESYLVKVDAAYKALKAKTISEDEARKQVMGAVAEFSKESGLYLSMKKIFEEML